MTSIPNVNPAAVAPVRAQAAPVGPSPAMPVAAIDPIKLVQKYKWALVIAAAVGGIIGLGLHFILLRLSPVWRPFVLFQCHSVQTTIGELEGATFGQAEELDKFMQTQVRVMTSESVLQRVAEDPRLQQEAPRWSQQFVTSTGFNAREAQTELKESLRARVVPQTKFVELSMGYKFREDATAILQMATRKYKEVLENQAGGLRRDQKDALNKTVQEIERQITALQNRRNTEIDQSELSGVDRRSSEVSETLKLINQALVDAQQNLQLVTVQVNAMNEQLSRDSGIVYGEDLVEQVEQERAILEIKSTLSTLESNQQAILQRGFTREHREYRLLDSQIAGYRQNLEAERQRLLRIKFDSQLETLRRRQQGLQAQIDDFQRQRDEQMRRVTDITKVQDRLADIDKQIENSSKAKAEAESRLKNLQALEQLQSIDRVTVFQDARIPNEVSFPRLVFMLPLGVIGAAGLVGGFVVLRELVDQRVKGPSDVAMIPRVRVLGWVPDALEDPAGPGAVESAFRDRPRGVLAEAFRNTRSVVLKRMRGGGHKTLMVMAGMPGSGSTSIVANLALACAAVDQRVLIIDANFRRAGVHRAFGLSETGGVSDALSQGREGVNLESVLQKTKDARLDVVSAGSRDRRVFEMLSSDAMAELLRQAKERYDLILIDVAPAIVAGDGLALAQRVDASLLVVRALNEKRGMVARVKNDLSESQSDFLGVLVNGVRSSAGGYLKGNIRATHEYHSSGEKSE